MKMFSIVFFVSFLVANGQLPFTKTVSLDSWGSGPGIQVIPIQELDTEIVLQLPTHPAICPMVETKDFVLEKVNPSPNKSLIEKYVCQFTRPDTTIFNFDFVYKVFNNNGFAAYMQVTDGDLTYLKLRFTEEKPSLAIPKKQLTKFRIKNEEEYLANGKLEPGRNRISPKFRR